MAGSATDSVIDTAYWFINRAEDDGLFLDDEKLQHLLFLAQVHFAIKNNMEFLMPSLFVCGNDGFYEPNLKVMFSQGRPFMPKKILADKVETFLEQIWNKYATISLKELEMMIKSNLAYQNCYTEGSINIISQKTLVENFVKNDSMSTNNDYMKKNKKFSYSQNGPVVVSKWNPRKVSVKTIKGEDYV